MKSASGFIYGIISSATFGLIPLFTVPLLADGKGMPFMSVLTYRFIFATLFLAALLLFQRRSLLIKPKQLLPLSLLAVFYIISSLFLIWGYTFMSSGVATTIHFMYPVITTLLMMFLFHEKKSAWRIGAVITAIAGVYFLSCGDGAEGAFDWKGIVVVLMSALGYASYLVAIGQMKKLEVKGFKLTFYVFFLSTLILLVGMLSFGHLEPIDNSSEWTNLLLLAFIPTVISNITLVEAIKRIGSTLTSVLGAMEPVTAVIVGILVFNEQMTLSIGVGIFMIISAVIVIILKR